jgi:thiol-disulfide isomerase/thioredoxin
MTIKRILGISLLLIACRGNSQNFGGVYKINELLARITQPDTQYVVNFWATWCKPCVEELPAFDSLLAVSQKPVIKVLLVNLDFKEDLEKKVKPFLRKHGIKAECILLDEINGNEFVNKISATWSGAIPATLFKKGKNARLVEGKMKLSGLLSNLENKE